MPNPVTITIDPNGEPVCETRNVTISRQNLGQTIEINLGNRIDACECEPLPDCNAPPECLCEDLPSSLYWANQAELPPPYDKNIVPWPSGTASPNAVIQQARAIKSAAGTWDVQGRDIQLTCNRASGPDPYLVLRDQHDPTIRAYSTQSCDCRPFEGLSVSPPGETSVLSESSCPARTFACERQCGPCATNAGGPWHFHRISSGNISFERFVLPTDLSFQRHQTFWTGFADEPMFSPWPPGPTENRQWAATIGFATQCATDQQGSNIIAGVNLWRRFVAAGPGQFEGYSYFPQAGDDVSYDPCMSSPTFRTQTLKNVFVSPDFPTEITVSIESIPLCPEWSGG